MQIQRSKIYKVEVKDTRYRPHAKKDIGHTSREFSNLEDAVIHLKRSVDSYQRAFGKTIFGRVLENVSYLNEYYEGGRSTHKECVAFYQGGQIKRMPQ